MTDDIATWAARIFLVIIHLGLLIGVGCGAWTAWRQR